MPTHAHPADAMAKALTGPSVSTPVTRLDALRRLEVLLRTPAVAAALRSEANSLAEADWLLVALEALILDANPALAAWEKAKAASPQPVAIIIQGGVVQDVCSATPLPQLRFETVDYDVDGADESECEAVRFIDGTRVGAWRSREPVTSPSDIDWAAFDADPT